MSGNEFAHRIVNRAPDGVAAVIIAWCDAGISPEWHADMRIKLEEEWPVLAYAVDRLVAEYGDQFRRPGREHAEWFRPGQVKQGPRHARPDHQPDPEEENDHE